MNLRYGVENMWIVVHFPEFQGPFVLLNNLINWKNVVAYCKISFYNGPNQHKYLAGYLGAAEGWGVKG